MISRLRKRLGHEGGFTLIEMLVVMSILSLVLGAIVVIFVSGIRAQKDATDRLVAQQEARIAVDRLRREVHCARTVTLSTTGDHQVTLDFPQVNGADVCGFGNSVIWKTQAVAGFSDRFQLLRNDIPVADYLTQGDNIFAPTPPSATALGGLSVTLPVNPQPAENRIGWNLESQIILRNSQRST